MHLKMKLEVSENSNQFFLIFSLKSLFLGGFLLAEVSWLSRELSVVFMVSGYRDTYRTILHNAIIK